MQPTRRQALTAGTVLLATACTTDDRPDTAPSPTPDVGLRSAAVAREQRLVAAYERALADQPELAARLGPLLADHQAHLAALRGEPTATPTTPAPTRTTPGAASRSRPLLATPLPAATGTPTPTPTPTHTPSPTPSPTHSPTRSPTPSPTHSPTHKPTHSPSPSPRHSATPSPTPTAARGLNAATRAQLVALERAAAAAHAAGAAAATSCRPDDLAPLLASLAACEATHVAVL